MSHRAIPKPRTPPDAPGPQDHGTGVDRDLLWRLQRGDRDALGELFQLFGDRVYNTCRRITGCAAEAEDATQEVFLRVLAKAHKFDGRSRFSTWLFRLTVNHTLNLHRRRGRRPRQALDDLPESAVPVDDHPQPLESVALREERRCLDEALQNLPTDQRAILVLRELEGLSYAEIAAVLGLPVGTVTSRLIRGRERLTAILRRRLPDSETP